MANQNIFIIICDQLSAAALSSYGNSYARTPHLDQLAKDSVVFEHTYTNCPLCQPSRASFWSSRYPHQTGIRTNLPDQGFPALPETIPTLGELFSRQGYHCVHFGKTHDYGSLRGFEVIESQQIQIPRTHPGIKFDYETYLDLDTTRKTLEFLHNPHPKPFLAVADLQNPHNICAYIGESAEGYIKPFPLERELPPLPDNFEFTDIANRPEVIQYMCCAHRRQRQASGWTEDDYRHYLYAYYYYLEMVDRQIGELLAALEQNHLADNTLVVFFSDHGEGMAAHQLVTKYAAFYEETNHVPLFFRGPDFTGGRRIGGVCSLLDLVPTLLDYAGYPIPEQLEGHSLLPELTGATDRTAAAFVYGQWHDEFHGYTVPGRMVCDTEYKYIHYLEADRKSSQLLPQNDWENPLPLQAKVHEELYHLAADPLETRNLAVVLEYQPILEQYRKQLDHIIAETQDDFYQLQVLGTEHYRHHPVGFQYHQGLSAVERYAQSLPKK